MRVMIWTRNHTHLCPHTQNETISASSSAIFVPVWLRFLLASGWWCNRGCCDVTHGNRTGDVGEILLPWWPSFHACFLAIGQRESGEQIWVDAWSLSRELDKQMMMSLFKKYKIAVDGFIFLLKNGDWSHFILLLFENRLYCGVKQKMSGNNFHFYRRGMRKCFGGKN